jgi:DNA-binding NtrC family response regulator
MQCVAAALPVEILLAVHVSKKLGHLRAPGTPWFDATIPPVISQFRPLAEELRELEIARIREALEATGGNQTHAAGLLSMSVRTFFEKAKQYKLTPKRKTL